MFSCPIDLYTSTCPEEESSVMLAIAKIHKDCPDSGRLSIIAQNCLGGSCHRVIVTRVKRLQGQEALVMLETEKGALFTCFLCYSWKDSKELDQALRAAQEAPPVTAFGQTARADLEQFGASLCPRFCVCCRVCVCLPAIAHSWAP